MVARCDIGVGMGRERELEGEHRTPKKVKQETPTYTNMAHRRRGVGVGRAGGAA